MPGSTGPDVPEVAGMERFSPATRSWFGAAFDGPTPAQIGAWAAVGRGEHTLVVAPTGSGKTLSAFLWALDRLATAPAPSDRLRRCRVLYVSPLKALGVDVARNLQHPLEGIRATSDRLGLPVPDIRVGVRSGDTSTSERRSLARTPPDILITTPESLFLLLTSQARVGLQSVDTVVLDEVHAIAATKRGAHLALSLERLDALLPQPAQRIGLSATVRPTDEVARFLAGGRPVTLVRPAVETEVDLRVVVPVPDLSSPIPTLDRHGEPITSIWPHVEESVVDLVAAHRSTLVFANSRRLVERLTARLNEIWTARTDPDHPAAAMLVPSAPVTRPSVAPAIVPPAQMMAQAPVSLGAPAVLARAHHGSVSKEQRALVEADLKDGLVRAVVATSSLELGIDMGSIDLVVQVESPPSVASGLQRIGRAGHQVGAVSQGVMLPKFRGDLLQMAVVAERMRGGLIEELHVPANPLDVLAQQVVAMTATDSWTVDDLARLVAKAAPFSTLSRAALEAVLDMLAGRYPDDELTALRPRIVWDRDRNMLSARPGAQRLAVTSGGTIPDRGLFGVFLTGDGAGRRVGELDEVMVYESRVGDVFTLGTSSWRIDEITHDQVRVSPAPGRPGKLPFWHGDGPGRPAELGRAIGSFVREISEAPEAEARERLGAIGLDGWATDNLIAYLRDQRQATGQVPDDQTVVIESFADEMGDRRVVVHSPWGARVHAAWALIVAARVHELLGVDPQIMHSDDGLVLRLPEGAGGDLSDGGAWSLPAASTGLGLADLLTFDPDEVPSLVTEQLGGSALFAARFRECASRALMLPRQRMHGRSPLWQQRHRAGQLLSIVTRYPQFPIVLETVRECLQDVFDVPALVALQRDLAARRVRVVEVQTPAPSPFAHGLLFGYVAQFLYEGDTPLAERRAAALALDPALLADLLGHGEGASLRDLLDPEVVTEVERDLQALSPDRKAGSAEQVADLIRRLGPLPPDALALRCAPPDLADGWASSLIASGRVIEVQVAGTPALAAVEDAGHLRDGLGVDLPSDVPTAFTQSPPDPVADLVARHVRTHATSTAGEIAIRLGLGIAVVRDAVSRLVSAGRVIEAEVRPDGAGLELCDPQVLRQLRRRSLAALRHQLEPVPARAFGRFLPAWQSVDRLPTHSGPAEDGTPAGVRSAVTRAAHGPQGASGLLEVVAQLAGAVVPASALETLVLPSRIRDWSPSLIDTAMSSGEVLWCGHAAVGTDDGWVSLHPAESAPLTLPVPSDEGLGPRHHEVIRALSNGGAFFFRSLAQTLDCPEDELSGVLWDLVWSGRVTNDTLAPLRAVLGGARTPPRRVRHRGAGRPRPWVALPRSSSLRVGARPGPAGVPQVAGRWSLLPSVEPDPTRRAAAQVQAMLARHGVLTRGAVTAERTPGGFAAAYRVLSALEETGAVRRGYAVEHLGAAQFALEGALDRLRLPGDDDAPALVLAAADPANPYGAALPWPPTGSDSAHRPSRRVGAIVVMRDGAPVLHLERGGHRLLTFPESCDALPSAARALADAVRVGAVRGLTIEQIDGRSPLSRDSGPASGPAAAAALIEAGFHLTPRGLRLR